MLSHAPHAPYGHASFLPHQDVSAFDPIRSALNVGLETLHQETRLPQIEQFGQQVAMAIYPSHDRCLLPPPESRYPNYPLEYGPPAMGLSE